MVSSAKTSNSRPTSSSVHTIVFFFCVFDAIDAIVKKLMDCTHGRKHGKAQQAHMKKMARNEDAFTQGFEQQKGSGLVFFFGFGAIGAYGPKTRKK